MRFKLSSLLTILLIVGSNDARPSKAGGPEVGKENGENAAAAATASTGIADESSSKRPNEPRSSSVVKSDSRYRGRTENNTQLSDKYYRGDFSPGLVNSFEIEDDNFGLPNDWRLLETSRIFKSNGNVRSIVSDRLIDDFKSLRFSITKSVDSPNPRNTNTSKNQNGSIKNVDFPLPDSRIAVKAKNRVVLKSDYHEKPLRYENHSKLTKLTPQRPIPDNRTGNYELKNWPNDALENVEDLYNYEKYTSNIEPTLINNFVPIKTAIKKRKKKPNINISGSGTLKPQYPSSSTTSNYYQLPSSTQQSLPSSSTYDDKPPVRPNVQEIIKWLQIPAFGTKKNQSYSVVNVLPGESVTKPLDHTYHEFGVSRPIASATATYFEPEINYSGIPATSTAQSYTDEIPTGITYYQQVQSPDYRKPDNYQQLNPQLPIHQPSINYPSNYQNFPNNENHHSSPPSTVETVSLPTAVVTLLTDLASKQTHPKWPVFRPSSEITQNTVVHILNPGSRRPNVTVSEMPSVPQVEKPLSPLDENNNNNNNVNGPATPPNVHIMFMNEDMQNNNGAEPLAQSIAQNHPLQDKNCPTIMINSITRVNNTIESKEGCTDLNIVINSQVLSTNVFNPGSSVSQIDEDAQDKYVDAETSSDRPSDSYNSVEADSDDPQSGESEQDSDRDEFFNNEAIEQAEDDGSVFGTSSQVTQQSEIFVSTGNPEEGGFDALGAETDPVDSGDVSPSLSQPPVSEIRPSLGEPGVAVGQAIGDSSAGGPFPGLGAGAGPLSGLASGGSAGTLANSPDSTALTPMGNGGGGHDDDDDDDDDYFDMNPSGLMESVGSIFTYFSFMNPFNYGLFSIAAAPFAAMAAGFIGIAAVFFPWALPGVIELGRAATADQSNIVSFRQSLDQRVVGQSIHKQYRDWHESKSKRKKRKR